MSSAWPNFPNLTDYCTVKRPTDQICQLWILTMRQDKVFSIVTSACRHWSLKQKNYDWYLIISKCIYIAIIFFAITNVLSVYIPYSAIFVSFYLKGVQGPYDIYKEGHKQFIRMGHLLIDILLLKEYQLYCTSTSIDNSLGKNGMHMSG